MNCGWRSMKGKVLPASPDLRYIKVPGWGKGPGYRNLPMGIACCLMLLTFSPFFGMMFDVLLCTLTSWSWGPIGASGTPVWTSGRGTWGLSHECQHLRQRQSSRTWHQKANRRYTIWSKYMSCSYYRQLQYKSHFFEGIWLRFLCANFDRWVEGRKSGESLVVAPMITATRSVLQWTPFREKNTKPPPTVRKPCLTLRESIRTTQNTSTRPCNTPLKKKPKKS